MRISLLQLPLALVILAPLGAAAQDAPRVIFCQGGCFAVDANGNRTPAQKGTRLREGQRLETGPGAYAQLKIGASAALGVGEGARLGFDQKSVRDNDVVMLDRGRIRILDGDALNKTVTARHVELHTSDGIVAMRGGDMEAKRLATGAPGANLTYLKLNAGDASLRSDQTNVVIPTTGVLGITAGKVITDRTFSVVDVALLPARVTSATGGTATATGLPTLITGMVNLPPAAVLNTPLTTTGGTAAPISDLAVGRTTISGLPVSNLMGVAIMPAPTSLAVTNVAVFAPTNATLFTLPPATITQTIVPVSMTVPQKVIGDTVATLLAPMPPATTTTPPTSSTPPPAPGSPPPPNMTALPPSTMITTTGSTTITSTFVPVVIAPVVVAPVSPVVVAPVSPVVSVVPKATISVASTGTATTTYTISRTTTLIAPTVKIGP